MRYTPGAGASSSGSPAIQPARSRPLRVAVLLVAILSLVAVEVRLTTNSSASSAPFPLPYAGVNYYDPSVFFTHCPSYTWLRDSNYSTPSTNCPGGVTTPSQQLGYDLKFVSQEHVGAVQSLSISLDQILEFNAQTGAYGFTPGALQNVDAALAQYHQRGIKVLLILFVYDHPGAEYEFRPWAIDGEHQQMEANYLKAASTFIRHLAANPVDAETAPIIDLQDEAYYQFEVYYDDVVNGKPDHLGKYTECETNTHKVDTGCVDTKIVYPWLKALYDTARSASTKFLYTISDTHRLFEDYSYWIKMYPEDVIDEHLYDSAPWKDASMYAQAKKFDKPWFAGEVGCDSYDTQCTYVPSAAAPVDSWWLTNLAKDGAQSVFVESKNTAWDYPGGPDGASPTQVGAAIQSAEANIKPNPDPSATPTPDPSPTGGVTHSSAPSCPADSSGTNFVNKFDSAPTGAVRTSPKSNHFSGVVGPHHLQVENFLALSKPKALDVKVTRGGSAYVYRSFASHHMRCQLQFSLLIGHGFALSPSRYLVLAETRTGSSSNTGGGMVEVVLGGQGNIFLEYTTASGHQEYFYPSTGTIDLARWYTITLREIVGSSGHGSLTLFLNGKDDGTQTNLDLGSKPLAYFAVGDEYTPHSGITGGDMYIDNVSATGSG